MDVWFQTSSCITKVTELPQLHQVGYQQHFETISQSSCQRNCGFKVAQPETSQLCNVLNLNQSLSKKHFLLPSVNPQFDNLHNLAGFAFPHLHSAEHNFSASWFCVSWADLPPATARASSFYRSLFFLNNQKKNSPAPHFHSSFYIMIYTSS